MREFKNYANAIIESQGCKYCGYNEEMYANCYQNDELGMQVKINPNNSLNGEMVIRFKSESDPNSRKKLEISTTYYGDMSETKFWLMSGMARGAAAVYIHTSGSKYSEEGKIPYIEISLFKAPHNIKIKLETKMDTISSENKDDNDGIKVKSHKVIVYDDYTNEVIGEIGIEQLSAEVFVNKIREILQREIQGELLEWFNGVFEIIRPALLLRIEEVMREWREEITRPVKKTQERIAEIDEQIAALTQERKARIGYLLDIDSKIYEMYLLCASSNQESDISKKA